MRYVAVKVTDKIIQTQGSLQAAIEAEWVSVVWTEFVTTSIIDSLLTSRHRGPL